MSDSVRSGQERVSFSYVIPVHNEASDVEEAIRAAEASARSYAPCEIVAVDDASTDGTREILRRYAAEGRISLAEQPVKKGAAAARNAGMAVATGDVVVFMDADNVVPPDFLERLRDHYLHGADFVTVGSRVVNQDRLVGRFQQASHQSSYDGLRNVTYSQSFSCRREIALAVGFNEPLSGSADGDFFRRLSLDECCWRRDPEIVVGHRMPDTLAGFCRQYAWRGESTVVHRRVICGTSLWLLTLRQIAVAVYWLGAVATVVPAVVAGRSRIRYSERGARDLPGFAGLWALQAVVCRMGEWRGLAGLWRQKVSIR